MKISVYTDGGSRGNPGTSGIGVVIFDEHQNLIYKESKFLGIKTNNEAEYLALLAALSWIQNNKDQFDFQQIHFFADSQLLVRQLQGLYKVKAGNLQSLFIQAQQLLSKISLPYKFQDIPRDLNKLADQLANQAMDQGTRL